MEPSTTSQCNHLLPSYKVEPTNRVNGNTDLLDLDSLVYNEAMQENNNSPRQWFQMELVYQAHDIDKSLESPVK